MILEGVEEILLVTGRQKYLDILRGAVADNPYVTVLLEF
jgi:hypothetical protein